MPAADTPAVDTRALGVGRLRSELDGVPFGVYVHVPFCQRRCGYCAFNTVAVGRRLAPADADRFVAAVQSEVALVAALLGPGRPPASTLYLGGGTPTMLDATHVRSIVQSVRERLDLGVDAEISIESNPDGLRPGQLAELRDAGCTRITFGLQSTRRRVLDLLDRTHDPELALAAVGDARRAGFRHVGLDLIYGTPGETADDWSSTLAAAVATGAGHVSAYALGVEPGTRLAARVRSGELPRPASDDAADRYVVADEQLSAAGLHWYELSNWARSPGDRSGHNLLYWRNHHWWGIGPGAHSHVSGVRWSNVRSTDRWAGSALQGAPAVEHVEVLDDDQRALERLMLGVRLAEGTPLDGLEPAGVDRLRSDGLIEDPADRLVLTRRGRLLADTVVRTLAF